MPLMPDAWVAQSAAATKKTNNSSRRKRVAELPAWKVLSGLDFAKKKSKGGVFVDDDQTSLQRARSRYQQAKRYAKSIISAATWEEDSQTVVRQMFNCDVNSGGMRSRCFLTTVEIEELRDVIAEAHEADEIELDGTEDVGTFEELLSNFDDNSHELVNLHRQRQESLMVYVLCLAQNGYKTESMKQRGDCLAMPKLPRPKQIISKEQRQAYNSNRTFQEKWKLQFPLLRLDPSEDKMFCSSGKEFNADNALGHGCHWCSSDNTGYEKTLSVCHRAKQLQVLTSF